MSRRGLGRPPAGVALPALEPDWPAPAGVRALFTLRGADGGDGASGGPWKYFNLGDHVGDAPAAVAANRARLREALDARPVFLQQVHGSAVAVLDHGTPDGTCADAAVTGERALACTILVADCLPLLLCDAHGRHVAALHAGWRGLAAGVVEQAVSRLRALAAASPATAGEAGATDLLAWLGPCIGSAAFEVGPEVRAAFVRADPAAATCFVPGPPGKYLADLAGLARQRLARLGVTRVHGNDGSPPWCTVRDSGRFFSHRRDWRLLGGSGRMAASIWRD